MIADSWFAALPSYLWQVTVHSWVMGVIFYAWAHRVRLPSGRTKRRLLAALLILPLVTAAVPGRATVEFAERLAWLNSARILAIPLLAGVRVEHVMIVIGLLAVALTIWQEVLPALRHPRTTDAPVPESLASFARAQPGWERCAIALSPLPSVMLATAGMPWRPRLIVSQGALGSLSTLELETVVVHEHAHWQGGRWLELHALFLVRLVQSYNPVALWVFREYCIEMEIACDAVAVSERRPQVLAKVLLRIYESTHRRDVATRASLRKRVDVLLEGGPTDAALPRVTMVAAVVVMAMVLPWIV